MFTKTSCCSVASNNHSFKFSLFEGDAMWSLEEEEEAKGEQNKQQGSFFWEGEEEKSELESDSLIFSYEKGHSRVATNNFELYSIPEDWVMESHAVDKDMRGKTIALSSGNTVARGKPTPPCNICTRSTPAQRVNSI